MRYREQDLQALKSPDILHAYAAAVLGQGVRRGRVWVYPCPFGAHTRPHLELAERDGCGVALCRACNMGGTVYHIAAAVLGLDAKKDFIKCAEEIAAKTGAHLAPDDAPHARRAVWTPRPPMPCRRPADTPPPLVYLPADDEAAALDAVRHAAARPDILAEHAAALGLPLSALLCHTDLAAADSGLLGLTPDKRLLYVYTARDPETGAPRVTMTKRRGMPQDKPRFLARGSKQGLFGADAAAHFSRVIITEGETDALAVRASMAEAFSWWAQNTPDKCPPWHVCPFAVAKPDCGTFRPHWARPLIGKDVILAADNDAAGVDGARATAAILHAQGVRRVFVWLPPDGVKDARAAFDILHPWSLAEMILTDKKPI